jgi:autophagy-related protein 9
MTRPPGHLSSSRSQNLYPQHSMTGSRPFLNMLNPLGMSRAYGGYAQANQSVVEEEEENGGSTDEERDLEAQTRHGHKRATPSNGAARRQVSWEAGGASEMNILRPNIRQQDKIYEQDSSDGEVPQSFMIEAQTKPSSAGTGRFKGKGRANPRTQPLNSIPSGRTLPPILSNPGHPPLPGPAHPSDVSSPADTHPPRSSPTPRHRQSLSQGLDAYERALWNWVNIYNLDAFLQEVYYYYEGKGIYSIALARGLNLLFVILEQTIIDHESFSHYNSAHRTVGFVIGFSTFLLGCVDYSRIRPEGITRLSDVVVDRCISKYADLPLSSARLMIFWNI